MQQEFGKCENCPKGFERRGLLAASLKGELVPDPTCPGPELVRMKGTLETDFPNGITSTTTLSLQVCAKELTPEISMSLAAIEMARMLRSIAKHKNTL